MDAQRSTAREGDEPFGYRRIVVGVGEGPGSRAAADRAGDIAARTGGTVFVVVAYDPLPRRDLARMAGDVPDTRVLQVASQDSAEALVDEAVTRLRARGADVQGVLVEFEPAHALELVALENGADLVVVGNAGVGSLFGRLLGAPAVQVLRRVSCDVLVVAS